MFAGGQRRSSNVRAMQLFHELKQQFPTVPDHIVSSCISNHSRSSEPDAVLREHLEALAAQELMGRSPPPTPPTPATPQNRHEMNETESVKPSVSYSKQNDTVQFSDNSDVRHKIDNSTFYAKRPDTLGIKPETVNSFDESDNSRKLQLSEKCKDVFKLLNQVIEKPPRSPLTAKRLAVSPDVNRRLVNLEETGAKKKETVSTPTQTTDTLVSGVSTPSSVNVSVNVNCSMDVVQSPTKPKRTSVLQVTPQQPWLQDPISPRSYTSVNLTLRPPSTEPQAPIDITSQNSSLTYSTSSFDSQRGLQSQLQITVGPGGGSVASVRVRPRSSYHPQTDNQELLPARAGSLNSLVDNDQQPVIIQQQARIERLKIELKTEKAKLVVKREDLAQLEKKRQDRKKEEQDILTRLTKEINHLLCQCQQLAAGDEGQEFYQSIYTGQNNLNRPFSDLANRMLQRPAASFNPLPNTEWHCSMCTFLNHPDLSKCEQCEMPKTYHVSAAPGENIHIHVTQRLPRNRIFDSWVL